MLMPLFSARTRQSSQVSSMSVPRLIGRLARESSARSRRAATSKPFTRRESRSRVASMTCRLRRSRAVLPRGIDSRFIRQMASGVWNSWATSARNLECGDSLAMGSRGRRGSARPAFLLGFGRNRLNSGAAFQFISVSVHGRNEFVLESVINFLSQKTDMDIHGIGERVGIGVPDMFHDHGARERYAGIAHEIFKETKLFPVEADRHAGPGNRVADGVEH